MQNNPRSSPKNVEKASHNGEAFVMQGFFQQAAVESQ